MKRIFILFCMFLMSCTITGNVIKEFGSQTEAYFCPRMNCTYILMQYFSNANKIDCAMYDLNVPELVNVLKNKKARMVMDDAAVDTNFVKGLNPVIDSKYSQMHNKFCVLDNQTVITGSFNPTLGTGIKLNNNNVLVMHSRGIAEAYEKEFEVLYSGVFSKYKEKIQRNNVFYLNDEKIEVYFCPEDWCANKVIYALNNAKSSIYFLIYSFTHKKIRDILVKKKNQGIFISGIMEKSQSGQYSQFQKLNQSGIDVKWDKNKGLLHHKVFIIDENTVITGSFNPTINGDVNNDENLVIIHSPEIAKKYLEEFNFLSSSWFSNP